MRKSEKAGDRTQSNRDPRKHIWAFCNPFFHLLRMVQLKHKFFLSLILLEVWASAVDSLHSVHKLSYLDTTKIKVKIQRSFSFLFWTPSSSMEHCLWNFPSRLAKWPPPVSYVFSWCFFQHCDCFQSNICFIQINDQFFFCYPSPSSLNVWKTVVKFLGVIAVLLVIQSWEDAAASQLR